MYGKFKKFVLLSWSEKLLFTEALFLQLIIGLLLKIIPFRSIPKLFPSHKSRTQNREPEIQSPQECKTQNPESGTWNLESGIWNLEFGIIIRIKRAIQHTSTLYPWRNKCLIQSLAARRMLKRRKIPSQLSLGVGLGGNSKMIAHAWLKSGDLEIVEKRGDYSELYLF